MMTVTKRIALILSVVCLFTMLFAAAHADGATWHCDTCDADRDTAWCPTCGARRPAEESWVCPECGKTLPAEYIVCPDDGHAKVVSTGTWPVMELSGASTDLRPVPEEEMRRQAFFGPSSDYPGAGGYQPYKVLSAYALFREGGFVLVDLDYLTVGKRCVYFKSSYLTNDSVDAVTLTGYAAKTTAEIQPMYGPGSTYDLVTKATKNKETGRIKTEKVLVRKGAEVTVFFETDGWVFAEFSCNLGTIRAWLPAEQVQAV